MSASEPIPWERMIQDQILARGVNDPRVIHALRQVDRMRFVPSAHAGDAYADNALPTRDGQTISQPYVVALMTQMLDVQPHHLVLEIGTGTGYQTAILSELAGEVISIERMDSLASAARVRLAESNCRNVTIETGDGWKGWPMRAPYDRILVTAGADALPMALVEQLALFGRMVIPLGVREQFLYTVERTGKWEIRMTESIPVRFVPLIRGNAS